LYDPQNESEVWGKTEYGHYSVVKSNIRQVTASNLGNLKRYFSGENGIVFKDHAKSKPWLLNPGIESLREVTAYNVGDPTQNYGDPCQSANGENICAALAAGLKRCAANFVPFGTKLLIAGYGTCTVTDRMNRRYRNRVDIAMKKKEKEKALQFGLKKLKVKIVHTQKKEKSRAGFIIATEEI
jgi:3D (Asp-Asp-Asp) domain-containing protein